MDALLAAYNELETDNKPFQLISYQFLRADRPHIVNIDGNWQYNPACLQELETLIRTTRPKMAVSMLQGEQAILAGLIAPERPFEFYFSNELEEFDASVEIIPFSLLLAIFREQHGVASPFLCYLKPLITVPIFALSFPPPINDPAFVVSHSGDLLGNQQLAPARWRYRIWKAHSLALQAIYHENGIPFIDPPPASYGDDHYLHEEFWHDAVHANVRYGHLLLLQLKDLFAEGQTENG